MSTPPDRVLAQLLEAAMKAEFAESQISLAQRISNRIAVSPPSNRHQATAMTASVPVILNPSSVQLSLPPNPQITPRIPSRHLENAPQLDPQQPLLSIDPLQLSASFPPPTTTSAPHLEAEEHQNLPNSPQRSLPSDPKTRAEATKEKNRRAQQRFRHKQKSRLELLECEVTRLRNLLRENGIEDPGSRVTDSTIEEEEIVPPLPPVRLVAGPSEPPKARSPSPDHPPDHPPVS